MANPGSDTGPLLTQYSSDDLQRAVMPNMLPPNLAPGMNPQLFLPMGVPSSLPAAGLIPPLPLDPAAFGVFFGVSGQPQQNMAPNLLAAQQLQQQILQQMQLIQHFQMQHQLQMTANPQFASAPAAVHPPIDMSLFYPQAVAPMLNVQEKPAAQTQQAQQQQQQQGSVFTAPMEQGANSNFQPTAPSATPGPRFQAEFSGQEGASRGENDNRSIKTEGQRKLLPRSKPIAVPNAKRKGLRNDGGVDSSSCSLSPPTTQQFPPTPPASQRSPESVADEFLSILSQSPDTSTDMTRSFVGGDESLSEMILEEGQDLVADGGLGDVTEDTLRRHSHILAEKKRRDNINSGFEELQAILPAFLKNAGGRFSKASILHKAVDYISYLLKEKTGLLEEVDRLRKEVQQLRMVIQHYQALGMTSASGDLEERARVFAERAKTAPVLDMYSKENIKFFVFCNVVDALFETFSAKVSLDSSEAFSSSLLAWFDEHCAPDTLRQTFLGSLMALGSRLFTEDSAAKLRKWGGALSACKDTLVLTLDSSSVPYAKRLGQTIDYVGTMCYLDAAPRPIAGAPGVGVSPFNVSMSMPMNVPVAPSTAS